MALTKERWARPLSVPLSGGLIEFFLATELGVDFDMFLRTIFLGKYFYLDLVTAVVNFTDLLSVIY